MIIRFLTSKNEEYELKDKKLYREGVLVLENVVVWKNFHTRSQMATFNETYTTNPIDWIEILC